MWLIRLKWQCRRLMPCFVITMIDFSLCCRVKKYQLITAAPKLQMSLIAQIILSHSILFASFARMRTQKMMCWMWNYSMNMTPLFNHQAHFATPQLQITVQGLCFLSSFLWSTWLKIDFCTMFCSDCLSYLV